MLPVYSAFLAMLHSEQEVYHYQYMPIASLPCYEIFDILLLEEVSDDLLHGLIQALHGI